MATLSLEAGFKPLPDMHIVTPGTEGADCFAQVQGLLMMRPELKVMLGSLMAWCQDDLVPNGPSYWQRPWVQHCWLVDEDGRVIDPALRNLEHWADSTECTLPCAVEDMTATVSPWRGIESVQQTVQELVTCEFNATPAHPLMYLPGAIFGLPHDLQHYSKDFYGIWGGAAAVVAEQGGLGAEDFDVLLTVLNKQLAKAARKSKPARPKTVPSNSRNLPHRGGDGPKGFG